MYHIIVVGAVYADVILHLESFPDEDSKTRVKAVEHRRGGNGSNSLSVLSQLQSLTPSGADLQLQMAASFAGVRPSYQRPGNTSVSCPDSDTSPAADLLQRGVSLTHSHFYGDAYRQPTAWILATSASRTILNENMLPDYTASDFRSSVIPAIRSMLAGGSSSDGESRKLQFPSQLSRVWVHFEGRCVDEIQGMITSLISLRKELGFGMEHLCISVEFEKPGRPGLARLLSLADVCFLSKPWVMSEYNPNKDNATKNKVAEHILDPCAYLIEISRDVCKPGARLFATWGEKGAYFSEAGSDGSVIHISAPDIIPIDTIGAGDTFVAGIIFGIGCMRLTARQATTFATCLASSKCAQIGFDGLLDSAADSLKSVVID
ncbi:hypothetical protein BSLG_005520 [Batrachochytrium salamandrivorans]|nr:hypothetical protein BASA60_010863 [Batrachochytrium salamandrivorans]KAJ1339860.1 hypothetical protein BSLG_005520 [Batrachochytrium salamandrivorans]